MIGGHLLAIVVCLWGQADPSAEHAEVSLPRVAQVWASSGVRYANTDSLASCVLPDGSVRLFATAKDGHRIDVFDASTGRHLEAFGRRGSGPGELEYPNGIAAVGLSPATPMAPGDAVRPVVLVVERDNARVQAFWPDSLRPAGVFGTGELVRPYGISVSAARGGPVVYVTDTRVPHEQTVHMYRLRLDGARVVAEHLGAFGDAAGSGVINEAESLVVDDRFGRVLLCDEAGKPRNVKVYTLDGRFTGTTFADGLVHGDPEGIVICDGPQGGCVILTDQQHDITVWHLFDRRTYRHLGAWTGKPLIANTDGICVHPGKFPGFEGGALFAVHDDADIRAYRLEDIVKLSARR